LCVLISIYPPRSTQDRLTLWLSRLVLLSVIEILDLDQSVPPRRYRARPRGRPSGQRKWQHEILHGCRLERSRGTEARIRAYFDHGPGGQRDGHGGVHHTRNVISGTSQTLEGSVSVEGASLVLTLADSWFPVVSPPITIILIPQGSIIPK